MKAKLQKIWEKKGVWDWGTKGVWDWEKRVTDCQKTTASADKFMELSGG